MIRSLDNFLNRITAYKLTEYVLAAYLLIAFGLSTIGLMPFGFKEFGLSVVIVLATCWLTNKFFAWILRVPVNSESVYITAFILSLIILPAVDNSGYLFLVMAGALAMVSKFLLAINRRHIFNPAALAVVATFFLIGQGASWWVGNMYMLGPILVGGGLIVRKIRRWDMVYAFLVATFATTISWSLYQNTEIWPLAKSMVIYSPLAFFATIMFTEPFTSPPTKILQVWYGSIVGVLSSPIIHSGSFYLTPEIALLAGNIYSYSVSFKSRVILTLLEKNQIGDSMHEFVFNSARKFRFQPGQYMEWTLGHKSDNRGNRRYFTIASSPTEDDVRLGVKFYPESSSYKKALLELPLGSKILAGQLAGDFTLPKDEKAKLIFIAGGIGITPFRSMLKHLIDTNSKTLITLFYTNKSPDEIIYEDILAQAQIQLGIKTIYTLTADVPDGWPGERGRLDSMMIEKYVPDYHDAIFYISGTHSMVTSMQDLLGSMGVSKRRIRVDFFPGF